MAGSLDAIRKVGPLEGKTANPPAAKAIEPAVSFDRVLAKQMEGEREVKFSQHAQTRLQQRQITLEAADVAKLERAVDRADQKGVKESLVLLDELALIVNVKNRTVITAMPASRAKDSVFTNIDGVVIA